MGNADVRSPLDSRTGLLRRGVVLEGVTVGYNALEGIIAIVAGLVAGSVALTGFGMDSVIEVTSGVVLWWRLKAELGAARVGPAVEARAARWAGVLLLALAGYIVVESGRRLLTADRPGESVVGIVLTALSLIVMPLLARAKLRVAASLGSRALRADAHETIVCAWLSATTLLGLGLNALLGWWWADPVAALAMLPLIVREGVEDWSSEATEGDVASASWAQERQRLRTIRRPSSNASDTEITAKARHRLENVPLKGLRAREKKRHHGAPMLDVLDSVRGDLQTHANGA